LAGPEPVEARSGAPLDYEHYLERQLRPIAQSIAQALGTSANEWLGNAGQLGLFASPLPGSGRCSGA
jgi:DNA polymerase II